MNKRYLKTGGSVFYNQRRRGNLLLRLVLVVALGLAIFLVWPSPIDPVAYEPPTDPGFTGNYAPNSRLAVATALPLADGAGPEDIEPLGDGRALVGLANGDIRLLGPNGQDQLIVNTGGRPLGLDRDAEGELLVADAYKGLLRITRRGEMIPLVESVNGVLLGFTDDVDIADDGIVYFSDASTHYAMPDLTYDFLSARPHGRLIAYDPASGKARVVADDLYFANGVAVAADGQSVLVNETSRYRVRRVWVKGPRTGESEIVIDNLPGFPDGISRAPDGSFWVALYGPRSGVLDFAHPHPWLKALMAKLPESWSPKPARYGAIMRINSAGEVLETLQDPTGERAGVITSVEEQDGRIWLGSLLDRYALVVPHGQPGEADPALP